MSESLSRTPRQPLAALLRTSGTAESTEPSAVRYDLGWLWSELDLEELW